jgi:hypothetical protein
MDKEGMTLILLKRRLPKKTAKIFVPAVCVLVAAMFLNNAIVISNAHFNHDEREKFVQFVDDNIADDNAIIIVDDSTKGFFNYYSDKIAINFKEVIFDPQVSDYINRSFDNGSAIYVGGYWLLDSFVDVGSARHQQTYEGRIELHREYVANFNSMYVYELAYEYEWSDVYRITALNETR